MSTQVSARPGGKMEFTLEGLLIDIKSERNLWATDSSFTKEQEDAAWAKIGKKNHLSGGEAKSLFKVLSKKYKQEAAASSTTWKLFNHLKFLDDKDKQLEAEAEETTDQAGEEETYVELLEVKDEDFSDEEMYSKDNSLEDIKPDLELLKEATKAAAEKENKAAEEKQTPPPPPAEEIIEKEVPPPTIQKRKASDASSTASPPRSVKQIKLVRNGVNGVVKNDVQTETEIEAPRNTVRTNSSFGNYVESTLNKLPSHLATKLEIKILQAIIEANSETIERRPSNND